MCIRKDKLIKPYAIIGQPVCLALAFYSSLLSFLNSHIVTQIDNLSKTSTQWVLKFILKLTLRLLI